MVRQWLRRTIGLAAGLCLAGATLGAGGVAEAFGGNPHYYDIGNLTPLARRAAISLYEEGIMNGTAPAKFAPYGQVTRAQAVKFVVNAMHLPLASQAPPSFSDVSRFSAYYGWIEAAAHAGLFAGWVSSSRLQPSAPITRVDFAVLATNALGDQHLAQSMAGDTATYGYLRDLGRVPADDLGAVNAMMKVGIVPPVNRRLYEPFAEMNREEFAVALMRLYAHLQPGVGGPVASAALTAKAATLPVGTADPLTVTLHWHGMSQTVTGSPYSLGWSIVGGPSGGASIGSSGVFQASQAGTYVVRVRVSGGGLPFAVSARATITVTAAKPAPQAAALSLAPTSADPNAAIDVPYNSQETIPLTVQALGPDGKPLALAGIRVTLSARSNLAGTKATIAGAGLPAVLTTDANGRVHADLVLTSPAPSVWTVVASASGATAAVQHYRIVSSVAGKVSVALHDLKTSSTSAAAPGEVVEATATVLGPNGKALDNHDVVELTVSPHGGFALDAGGNLEATLKAGRALKAVAGSPDSYWVRTDASGQVVVDFTAANPGTVTVQARDVSLGQPVAGQSQINVTK